MVAVAALLLSAQAFCGSQLCTLPVDPRSEIRPAVYRPELALLEEEEMPVEEYDTARALSYLGVRYRRGSIDPRIGIDCSGLVRLVYADRGLDLPHSAAGQFTVGERVEREDLKPGDLVFFRNTYRRGLSHVGIYLGEGRFVHAASRRRGVVISSLDSKYFRIRYAGARRLSLGPPLEDVPVAG
jgi:hypothetical protein